MPEKIWVGVPRILGGKGPHTAISTLGYVVGNTGSYCACDASHARRLIELGSRVKKELSMVSPELDQ